MQSNGINKLHHNYTTFIKSLSIVKQWLRSAENLRDEPLEPPIK
jgi:hypothetical protein